MKTNTRTYWSTNYYRCFSKYLKHKYQLDGKQTYEMLKNIHNPQYHGNNPLVYWFKQKLPISPNNQPIEEHPHLVIPFMYEILAYFETFHPVVQNTKEAKQVRLFTLLPFKQGFKCSYIKMCNTAFYALLKRSGVKELPAKKAWSDREVQLKYWNEYFHINKFETVNRKFAGEISTDGKGVSITLRKPKQESSTFTNHHNHDYEYDFDEIDSENWYGMDPGCTNMFVAVNGNGYKLSCTSREFYEDAKYIPSNKKLKVWQDKDAYVTETNKTIPSKKTTSLTALEGYIRYMLSRLTYMLSWYKAKRVRNLTFKRFVFSQKKLNDLVCPFSNNSKIVVGMGDWSVKDNGIIKKNVQGPVNRFRKRLKQVCKVVTIDEFRTSALHYLCHTRMRNMYSEGQCKDGNLRAVKIHSVLHCKSNGCLGMTVNRDVNSAQNHHRLLVDLLTGKERHRCYCRGVDVEKENCSFMLMST